MSCNKKTYEKRSSSPKLLFGDVGTTAWKQNWFLDGIQAKVINTQEGIELIAGPRFGSDSSHAVLWTKKSFKGNICIEYDYTRTDTTTRAVNILYFHATGKGGKEFPKDISLWNDKRTVPQMSLYFNNMNAYHISYAAFSAKEYSGDNDYIRLRIYNPSDKGLLGTEVKGDYFKTGLFKTDITYHVKVFKHTDKIKMHIENKNNSSEYLNCEWDISNLPSYNEGRIGFRQMFTRKARYKNIKVWELK
ncbi:DUF1961 family protein [Aestuariivivens sediminis]|uniref:DUF1961 family protein n=1 Tax=Aestuariivivens sediminis TaxID=2913557 RepID=UPI001F57C5D8|nr:DUF1961 family protein [Aestuariivivens sediminis]